jgi:hypothetical protein
MLDLSVSIPPAILDVIVSKASPRFATAEVITDAPSGRSLVRPPNAEDSPEMKSCPAAREAKAKMGPVSLIAAGGVNIYGRVREVRSI